MFPVKEIEQLTGKNALVGSRLVAKAQVKVPLYYVMLLCYTS